MATIEEIMAMADADRASAGSSVTSAVPDLTAQEFQTALDTLRNEGLGSSQLLSTPSSVSVLNEPSVLPQEDSGYGTTAKQFGFDLLAGLAQAGYGVADLATTPIVFLANQESADLPYFGISRYGQGAIKEAADILGVKAGTPMQEAVSFMTPTPFSKAKLGAQLLGGLTSYGAYKTAQQATDSELAALGAAVLAPGAASSTATRIARPVRELAGSEAALRDLAQREVLATVSPEGIERLRLAKQYPQLGVGAGGLPLTAAEIVQEPALAKYQQQVRLTEAGSKILEPAIQERATELGAALTRAVGEQAQTGEISSTLRGIAKQSELDRLRSMMGLIPSDAQVMTPMQRGETILASLQQRLDDSNAAAEQAWLDVPFTTKLNADLAVKAALTSYSKFGAVARKTISPEGKAVIDVLQSFAPKKPKMKNGVPVEPKPLLLTVNQLQDLRSGAGIALRNAQGKNPAEVKMMTQLRENIDRLGLDAAKSTGNAGAVNALRNAINVTKQQKKLYGQGEVSELLKTRRFEPITKPSEVVNKLLRKPENVLELITKFGSDAPELAEIRGELIQRLQASSKPSEFLTKNADAFNLTMPKELDQLKRYASLKESGAALEEYANITDSAIPSRVFNDADSAGVFVSRFKNTPIVDWTRRKFIDERILRGNIVTNLEKNRTVAEQLFGDRLPQIEKVLADVQASRMPQELESLASRRQSITSQRLTTIGQIASMRNVFRTLEGGSVPSGAVLGTLLGVGGNPAATVLAIGGGIYARQLGQMRLATMDKFVAQMLADPRLFDLASAPPTPDRLKQLLEAGTKAGYFAAVTPEQQKAQQVTPTPQASPSASSTLTREQRAKLLGMKKRLGSAPVKKQDVAALVADKPPIIKAMIQQESNFDPKAKSKKGAGGLMQLMPGTAKSLGVDDVFDPEQNVQAGERYYNQLRSQFKDERLALAAYNWGPTNVMKAQERLLAKDREATWANMLRYTSVPDETAKYVENVLQKKRQYEG